MLRWREPRERFLTELFWHESTQIDIEHHTELIAEGHQRIVSPLFCITFTLIALAAILSGEFSRRGHLGRILVAILAVILCQVANLGITYASVRTLTVVPLMYAVAAIPALAALWMIVHPHRRAIPRLAPAE